MQKYFLKSFIYYLIFNSYFENYFFFREFDIIIIKFSRGNLVIRTKVFQYEKYIVFQKI